MHTHFSKLILGAVLLAWMSLGAADDIIVADFESDTYGNWKVTGDAFGPGPAPGALPGQMSLSGFKGSRLVNSFYRGDGTTGTLASPAFVIERRFLGFLIGGGKDLERLALQLVIDDRVVRSATGPNNQAGGSEALAPESWDVSEFLGQAANLRVIDQATGGWGHINVDHIVQTDRKPAGIVRDAIRRLEGDGRYLNIPIRQGAPKRVLTLVVDGRAVVRNDVELAEGEGHPDWWAPMDLQPWLGHSIAVQIDRITEDSKALVQLVRGATPLGMAGVYQEALRGQFHFSPRRGWNNDPNGMVYYKGEYHLFFQHNPYGWGWGNMHWGHAVSRDLVHWEELGDKLLPDSFGPMFSGSAVVDWKNSSGLGTADQPPLVLIYTAAGNPTVQCIASSTDGRNFAKYPGNPVLPQITGGNRDPKVMWHAPSQQWVMVLYVELEKRHTVHFFTSPNLLKWSLASVSEGIPGSQYLYECPDFFELSVDNDPAKSKWVLMAANGEYAIGTFDGRNFSPEHQKLTGHRGRGFYAPQTFSDLPSSDGRRIQIGWFQTETRGMPFNQSMTVPLELKLASTDSGPRLAYHPVRELEGLRGKTHRRDRVLLQPAGSNPLTDVSAELMEIRAEFEPGPATEVIFLVRGATIAYEVAKQELVVNGHRALAPLRKGKLRLVIYVDRTGIEITASDGLCYVPMPFQPQPADRSLSVQVQGAGVTFDQLRVYELKSAWIDR